MGEATPASTKQTFLGGLFSRNVPQILATYAGVCWGLVQFTDWLSGRYQLAPALTDFVAFLTVLLFPTAVLLAWFRGEPGKTPWSRWEKIGLPLNALLAALVLWFVFQGSELGSINQTITVTDVNGRTVQRQVPKSAFRKRIALFFFENGTGDPKLDWLRQGLPNALFTDLSQDLYLDLWGSYDLAERIKKATFSYKDSLAVGLQKEIADYYRLPFFVTGTLGKVGKVYTLQVDLYETRRARRLTRRSYRGTRFFELIDEASLQLKRDVGVPEQRIDEAVDLPVTEVLTRSMPAFEAYISGLNLLHYGDDLNGSTRWLVEASTIDPSFAWSYLQQTENLTNSAQLDQARKADLQAKRYAFKLTESGRLFVSMMAYLLDRQPDKQLAVLKQWVTLSPDSLDAHRRLADLYYERVRYDESIAEIEEILKLDPEQYRYLARVGDLYRYQGRFEQSLDQYRRYAEKQPDRAAPYLGMADTYALMGAFKQAEDFYRKALSFEEGNHSALLGLAVLQERRGDLTGATRQARTLLQQSTLPEEKQEAYELLEEIYRLEGRWQEVLALYPLWLAELTKASSLINALFTRMMVLDAYIEAGRGSEALAIVRSLEPQAKASPLLRAIVDLGLLRIYLYQEDAARAEPLIARVERGMQAYGLVRGSQYIRLTWSRGKVAELRGEYRAAIDFYRQDLRENARNLLTHIDIGRCYRKLGEYEKARTALKEALRLFPAHPEAHYELAQVQQAEGDLGSARQEIALALKVWARADSSYDLARKARAFAVKLGGAGKL